MERTRSDDEALRETYEKIALTGDDNTTACDFHLRDLEIDLGLSVIRDGDRVLDVGCGLGVALRRYASERQIEAHGIDYAQNMVEGARTRLAETAPELGIEVQQASVEELPYDSESFDVVTSHRCLMALLDWGRQQKALLEIHRVLRPGGTLVLMEGTFDGVERLNFYRRAMDLDEIDPAGRDRLTTLKFREDELTRFVAPHYELIRTQRFGTYYFITRIVQPLLVAPERPSYDHPINAVAKRLARAFPDLTSMGHLSGFILRKHS